MLVASDCFPAVGKNGQNLVEVASDCFPAVGKKNGRSLLDKQQGMKRHSKVSMSQMTPRGCVRLPFDLHTIAPYAGAHDCPMSRERFRDSKNRTQESRKVVLMNALACVLPGQINWLHGEPVRKKAL